jgi:hypothetical protein
MGALHLRTGEEGRVRSAPPVATVVGGARRLSCGDCNRALRQTAAIGSDTTRGEARWDWKSK